MLTRVILKPGKEEALRRGHPWVFSGAIARVDGDLREGDIVQVVSSRGICLATGHYAQGSIAVKVFDFSGMPLDRDFWYKKLAEAFQKRKELGLTDHPLTNAYRLVHSEGDFLPGLIIDIYGKVAVIQCHTAGMYRIRKVLCDGLRKIYGESLEAVYDKSASTLSLSGTQDETPSDMFLFISKDEQAAGCPEILETGHRFRADVIRGQKTGFFLDQRNNRMLAQFLARDRKVLNAFCYSGAFSVYCLKGGATEVHSLDSSARALGWTAEHIGLNGISLSAHRTIQSDAMQFLAGTDERYDMVILDPPAFAKSHKVSNNALHAYIRINTSALSLLKPGGILMTFSCSQAISREMFRSALQSAAMETARPARLVHQLSQGPDHPVSIFHPEGDYLKGLVLQV